MSDLGDFLKVIYGPGVPFQTARGTFRQWTNELLAQMATGGNRPTIGRARNIPAEHLGQQPVVEEVQNVVWFRPPGQLRLERTSLKEGRTGTSLSVVNGAKWWNRNRRGEVTSHDEHSADHRSSVQPGMNEIHRHFSPASLREYFVHLILEQIGEVQTAGRDCLRVRGIPRPDGRLWPHWLPCGADEYEFHADAERGCLLSVAGLFGGEVFELSEVTQITYDEPLADGLFQFTPQAGEQVLPARPTVERLTLATAAARMPFVVLVPKDCPGIEASGFEMMHHPQVPETGTAALNLMFRGERKLWMKQSDAEDSLLAELDWEHLERDGQKLAISDPKDPNGLKVVEMRFHGTHVTIMSDFPRDELIRVALSLAPALP